jgi:hypothetical protein
LKRETCIARQNRVESAQSHGQELGTPHYSVDEIRRKTLQLWVIHHAVLYFAIQCGCCLPPSSGYHVQCDSSRAPLTLAVDLQMVLCILVPNLDILCLLTCQTAGSWIQRGSPLSRAMPHDYIAPSNSLWKNKSHETFVNNSEKNLIGKQQVCH